MKELDRTQLRNTLLLVLAAFIWGTAFVAQSIGSDYLEAYSFLASRSWMGCAFLMGLILVRRGAQKAKGTAAPIPWRTLVVGGASAGTMLFAASAAQQMGIATTTTAQAGFLTALYVILVPLSRIFVGKRPGLRIWVCVACSVVGLYLLCLAGHGSLALSRGEWLLLLCALLFTFQILLVDRYSPQVDGVMFSFSMFLATAILSTLFALLFEQPTVEHLRLALPAVAYCGILSSGVAYTLQIIGQRNLDPTIASIAMCLESVFSALAGWVVLHQSLTPTELSGCCLMFAAIIGAQLPARSGKANSAAPQD